MPVPRWMAQVNKRIFNPLEIRRGKRPVLIHTGRRSGETYQTPMDAHQIDGGYVFILMYTARSDWVKNVLAAGRAAVRVGGEEFELVNPRLIDADEARSILPPDTDVAPGRVKGIEYLRMDRA